MNNFTYNVTRIIVIGMLAWFSMFSINGCVTKPRIPTGVDPVVVSAAIVQANEALFRPGRLVKPAHVIFTLDPEVSNAKLKYLAHMILGLKETIPRDRDKRHMAHAVSEERYRPHFFLKVPYSISGSHNVYLAGVVVERDKLSGGYLQKAGVLLKCNLYLVDAKPHTITHIGEVQE